VAWEELLIGTSTPFFSFQSLTYFVVLSDYFQVRVKSHIRVRSQILGFPGCLQDPIFSPHFPHFYKRFYHTRVPVRLRQLHAPEKAPSTQLDSTSAYPRSSLDQSHDLDFRSLEGWKPSTTPFGSSPPFSAPEFFAKNIRQRIEAHDTGSLFPRSMVRHFIDRFLWCPFLVSGQLSPHNVTADSVPPRFVRYHRLIVRAIMVD
jgi:hypothetical protein